MDGETPRPTHRDKAAMNGGTDSSFREGQMDGGALSGAPAFEAVSYTHLDVYKRQLVEGAREGCAEAFDLGRGGVKAIEAALHVAVLALQ